MASQNPDEAPKRLSSDESLWGEQESKRKGGGPAFGVRVDQLPEDEPGGTLTTPAAPIPAPQRRWRLRRVDLLIGAAALVLLLPVSPDHMSIQIAVNGLVAFTWTTVLALHLRRTA